MSAVLFAFVGADRYSETTYFFEDLEQFRHHSSFLPQALLAALARRGRGKIDKLVLLGTTSSGWRALAESLLPAGDLRATTIPKEIHNDIDILNISEIFSSALSVECKAQLIPFALSTREQQSFIQTLRNEVTFGDSVHFDLTHGLRHLPMLTLVGALALRKMVQVTIAGIWYGAFHLTNRDGNNTNETPVVNLNGLLSIADWLSAIAVFDDTSDIDAFATPLRQEGFHSAAAKLKDAAFRERMGETYSARQSSRVALDALWHIQNSPGLNLVKPLLEERLGWAKQRDDENLGFYHATNFIYADNEVRALTIAYETALAKLSQHCSPNVAHYDLPVIVSRCCNRLRRSSDRNTADFARSYLDLKSLRNKAVHLGQTDNQSSDSNQTPHTIRMAFLRLVEILKHPVPPTLVQSLKSSSDHYS